MQKKIAVGMLVVSFVFIMTGCCLFHDWQEATCTEPKTCNKCGETEGEALGHTWEEATCTEPKTCSRCRETEGEALGHTWESATCITAKTCNRCRETEGEALGHVWEEVTCTKPKTCRRCKETEGEALGHNWEEATCTEPKTCSMCRKTEGEALGHSWEEATCTEPKTCSTCGETEGGSEHDWDWEGQNCRICGETIGKTVVNVDGVLIDIANTTSADIERLFESCNYYDWSSARPDHGQYVFAPDNPKLPSVYSDEYDQIDIFYVNELVVDFCCENRRGKHLMFYNNIKRTEDYYTVLSVWGDPDYTCNLKTGMGVYWRVYDSNFGNWWYIYGLVDSNRTLFIHGMSPREPVPEYNLRFLCVDRSAR